MGLSAAVLSKSKPILHIAQAVLLTLCIILTIGVFATSGKTDGRTGWFFGLCWLTIPILMYLAMVPAFPRRAGRFSNIYAFAVLDGVSVVLWLSGWAAVANYVVTGKGNGTVKDASGCDNFEYGPAAKCKISEATIVLGVVIMLLFVATAIISAGVVLEYKRTGILPDPGANALGGAGPLGGAKATGPTGRGGNEDEEAFDSNMNLRNEWEVEEYDHEDYHERYGAQGHDGRHVSGGYSQAAMDDHGDDDDHGHGVANYNQASTYQRPGSGSGGYGQSPRYNDNYNTPQPAGYMDDQDPDLSGQRPASTGPGPLGSNSSHYLPPYQEHNTYGR